MSESLLSYFEQELRFLREEASDFAARHPGTADALGIRNESVDDPQIARLIESVALLNGRLQQKLDDSFPELTESLIRLLYPHYLRPIPSYSLLNIDIGKDASAKHPIAKGTEFEVKDKEGNSALFCTTRDITLYPLQLDEVNVHFAPFKNDKPRGAENSKALIELDIVAVDEGIEISELNIDHLDLNLRGDSGFILRLYDLIYHSVSQICIQCGEQTITLGADALTNVGFDIDQAMLPYKSVTFDGYKLLTEFFMFPDKFNSLKVNLSDKDNKIEAGKKIQGNRFTLQFYLTELSVELARAVSRENFELYSVPVINLFKTTTEPLSIDFTRKQYPIVIDASNPDASELFSVDRVLDIAQNQTLEIPQIYSNKFASLSKGLHWNLTQSMKESGRLQSSFQVADLDNSCLHNDARTWVADVTCTNGNKASLLSANSDIRCRDALTIPGTMSLYRRPTTSVSNLDSQMSAWILLSHLQFNYQAVLGGEDPVANLKHIFHLYNHNKNPQNTAYIESISAIEQEHVVAPIRISGKSCFAYGTRIEVTLDDKGLNGGVELFSTLLDHFFSYFCGFNSFTQLDVKLRGKEGIYKRFARRSGCKSLL